MVLLSKHYLTLEYCDQVIGQFLQCHCDQPFRIRVGALRVIYYRYYKGYHYKWSGLLGFVLYERWKFAGVRIWWESSNLGLQISHLGVQKTRTTDYVCVYTQVSTFWALKQIPVGLSLHRYRSRSILIFVENWQ